MSESKSGGKRRKSKSSRRPTRRPTRTVKHRRQHRGGKKQSQRFIRPPTMDMPPHVQMDIDNPVSTYLADYYLNVDIERLSRKMFGAAVDKIHNTKVLKFSTPL